MSFWTLVKVLLGTLYVWVALAVALLSLAAPCGFAPGIWCELEGPSWTGRLLGFLGPLGVIAVFAVFYVAFMALVSRMGNNR